mmetsp:Transcript_11583/g.21663  ORF Transcript_11583/g.21663 Transcript_11583/m.21663 type:complete len:92 (+) Transcript_11583:2322-2597(+)
MEDEATVSKSWTVENDVEFLCPTRRYRYCDVLMAACSASTLSLSLRFLLRIFIQDWPDSDATCLKKIRCVTVIRGVVLWVNAHRFLRLVAK